MDGATRNGAAIIADALGLWAAGPVFHVPGEGMLDLLDVLAARQPDVMLVTCRHEAGMAYMAQAVGRLTSRPGVCIAGRAPGALNTCLALHTAYTDSAPMVLIVGQATSAISEREAFLGVDFQVAFGPLAKWVGRIDRPDRIPEMLGRAWHVATSGRMGPVVLIVPEDVLQAEASVEDLPAPVRVRTAPAAAEIATVAERLRAAARPMVIAGGGGWDAEGCAALARFASAWDLPVATAYRRRDLIDHAHPAYVGELGIGADRALVEQVEAADLLLVLGMRLGEINTIGRGVFQGFTLMRPPRPAQTLIHVHPAIEELNRVYRADLAICADPGAVAGALAHAAGQGGVWSSWREALRARQLAFVSGGTCPGPVDLREVFVHLRRRLDADAVVTSGAGAYALWAQRYFAHARPDTQLGPKSGAMGYGLPAAIAAALVRPGRQTVALAGDGCFLMHAEELATAVHYGLRIVTLVVNNGLYGAIDATQRRLYGRPVGTQLSNPDFADFARSFGAAGFRVERTDEFPSALERALAADGPAVIELVVPPEAVKPL